MANFDAIVVERASHEDSRGRTTSARRTKPPPHGAQVAVFPDFICDRVLRRKYPPVLIVSKIHLRLFQTQQKHMILRILSAARPIFRIIRILHFRQRNQSLLFLIKRRIVKFSVQPSPQRTRFPRYIYRFLVVCSRVQRVLADCQRSPIAHRQHPPFDRLCSVREIIILLAAPKRNPVSCFQVRVWVPRFGRRRFSSGKRLHGLRDRHLRNRLLRPDGGNSRVCLFCLKSGCLRCRRRSRLLDRDFSQHR